MSNKMTPEGKRLNVAAMAWWRANRHRALTGELLNYYMEPATRALVEACADLNAAQIHAFAQRSTVTSFALERGPQGEQLDGDTGPGSVE